jgi:O-antigen/teichoic acid export membrane protein
MPSQRWTTRRPLFSPFVFFALLYAGTAALQKGIGFIIFFWLAHSLNVQEYARFGLLYALQCGVATLAGAGILDSVIGLLKGIKVEARATLYSAANGVFLFLAVAVVFVASIVCFDVVKHGDSNVLEFGVVVVGGVLTAFLMQQTTLVRLEERHKSSLLLGFFGPVAGFLGAVLGFAVGGRVAGFYFGMMIGLLVATLVFRWARIGHYGISVGWVTTASIRANLISYILIALLAWLGGYGNTYIVQAFFPPDQVAKFFFAYTLSSIMHLVATSTNQVWSPRFFRLAHQVNKEDLEPRNIRFYTLQGIVLGVSGAFVLIALPFVLSAWGGNLMAYHNIHIELFLLFAGYAVSIPWWHAQNYFLVHGQARDLMGAVFASSVLGMLIWVVLMVFAGSIGIYVGFMVQMLLRSCWVFAVARKRWKLRVAWQGPVIALILTACPVILPIITSKVA